MIKLLGRRILLMLVCASQLWAADSWREVWTIGNFDGSSVEFRNGPFPETTPVYVIGTSSPGRDWYAFEPGSGNGPEGNRPHPAEVQFNLPTTPAGIYRLRIAILLEHPRISALQVEINGHAGRFYPRPKLDFRQGDLVGAFYPTFSSDTIDIVVPAGYLQKGKNRAVLTAVDEPEPRDQTTIGGTPAGDSGLVYDARELANEPTARYALKANAWAVPSIYYRSGSGQLKNVVDVFASYGNILRLQPGRFTGGTMRNAGGLVFFGDDVQSLEAVDAKEGKPLWHFNTGQDRAHRQ